MPILKTLASNTVDRINARVYHADGIDHLYRPRQMLWRVEAVALLKYHDAFAGRDVLDIGVGTGRTTAFLAPLCRSYHGIDYSPAMIRAMQRSMPGVETSLGDMRDMREFADASFDFVFAPNNVFDAVDHAGRLAALAECRRVLRPGGLLLFSGHNLGWRHAGAAPALEHTRNPVTQIARLGSWLRRRRNYRHLRPLCSFEADHATFCDEGHDFSLLHYYIGQAAQRRQLDDTGFDVVEVLDESGMTLAPDAEAADSSQLMYAALRRPDA